MSQSPIVCRVPSPLTVVAQEGLARPPYLVHALKVLPFILKGKMQKWPRTVVQAGKSETNDAL